MILRKVGFLLVIITLSRAHEFSITSLVPREQENVECGYVFGGRLPDGNVVAEFTGILEPLFFTFKNGNAIDAKGRICYIDDSHKFMCTDIDPPGSITNAFSIMDDKLAFRNSTSFYQCSQPSETDQEQRNWGTYTYENPDLECMDVSFSFHKEYSNKCLPLPSKDSLYGCHSNGTYKINATQTAYGNLILPNRDMSNGIHMKMENGELKDSGGNSCYLSDYYQTIVCRKPASVDDNAKSLKICSGLLFGRGEWKWYSCLDRETDSFFLSFFKKSKTCSIVYIPVVE